MLQTQQAIFAIINEARQPEEAPVASPRSLYLLVGTIAATSMLYQLLISDDPAAVEAGGRGFKIQLSTTITSATQNTANAPSYHAVIRALVQQRWPSFWGVLEVWNRQGRSQVVATLLNVLPTFQQAAVLVDPDEIRMISQPIQVGECGNIQVVNFFFGGGQDETWRPCFRANAS